MHSFLGVSEKSISLLLILLLLALVTTSCAASQEVVGDSTSVAVVTPALDDTAAYWLQDELEMELILSEILSGYPELEEVGSIDTDSLLSYQSTTLSLEDGLSPFEVDNLLAPETSAEVSVPSGSTYTIEQYAKDVEQHLGAFPSFDVRDGEIIPLTITQNGMVNGVVPGDVDSNTKVDRPPLLGIGNQAAPYSRIGTLPGINPDTGQPDPNILWAFIARRYYADETRGKNDARFEDVAIIGHHRLTGATAFFQMLTDHSGCNPDEKNKGQAGWVPSPMEPGSKTTDGLSAAEFWCPPSATADIACYVCHDNDPFIHTPYVSQVTVTDHNGRTRPMVPQSDDSPYWFIGHDKAFSDWPNPMQEFYPTLTVIEQTENGPREWTKQNACVKCHRIGTFATSEFLALSAAGYPDSPEYTSSIPNIRTRFEARRPFLQTTDSYKEYPNSHWMPRHKTTQIADEDFLTTIDGGDEYHLGTVSDWDNYFRLSVLQIIKCHDLFKTDKNPSLTLTSEEKAYLNDKCGLSDIPGR